MARSPRYSVLAAELRQSIVDGSYKIGDQLPTEHGLCDRHGVSRHTVRAAFQILENAGLIERRPGLGTIVVSAGATPAFAQALGGVEDLMQYAHEARLTIAGAVRATVGDLEAPLYRVNSGTRWLRIEGVRKANGRPVAATSILVADSIGAAPEDFADPSRAVTEHIERRYGVGIARIDQTIRAETLSETDAAALGDPPGVPCLRTIRRYFDETERPFVISDSRHPADRFVYEMSFRRRPT